MTEQTPPIDANTLGSGSGTEDDFIKMRLAELQEALDKSLPSFPSLLRDIHTKLRDDPEQAAALSDEEIAIIVKGLEKHGNIVIVSKATKASSRSKTPVSADDL